MHAPLSQQSKPAPVQQKSAAQLAGRAGPAAAQHGTLQRMLNESPGATQLQTMAGALNGGAHATQLQALQRMADAPVQMAVSVVQLGRTHNSKRKPRKTNTRRKRPTFLKEANALKVKGTDLSHRTSYESLRNLTDRFKLGEMDDTDFVENMNAIVGSDTDRQNLIEEFVDDPTNDEAEEYFIKSMNSAPENLRPGHSGRNRAIKGRFDTGVTPSKSKDRSRSPSPISKRHIITSLNTEQEVRFFTRGSKIESSQNLGNIETDDLISSLRDDPTLQKKIKVKKEGNEVVLTTGN